MKKFNPAKIVNFSENVTAEQLMSANVLRSHFHYRDAVESSDGSFGSIKITPAQFIDVMVYALMTADNITTLNKDVLVNYAGLASDKILNRALDIFPFYAVYNSEEQHEDGSRGTIKITANQMLDLLTYLIAK